MAPAKKDEALADIPGWSQGVRVNSAQRMVKLARPVCPNSQVEHERGADGRLRPKTKGPDQQNCMKAGFGWWDTCPHDPYFRTQVWYTTEDILEEDEKGRLIKKGEQYIKHELRQPNLAQVAVTPRINSGRGAERKIRVFGFKRLKDIGYAEVCQFRNCQKPVVPGATSRKYGAFCGKEHLALIVADVEQEMLVQPNSYLAGKELDKVQRRRTKQLREALSWATGVGDGE